MLMGVMGVMGGVICNLSVLFGINNYYPHKLFPSFNPNKYTTFTILTEQIDNG